MQRRENPAGGPGLKKNTHCVDEEDTTPIRLAGQGFCAPCAYFRAVKLASGRVRKLCSFTGELLALAGNPLCEFRQVEGGAA